MSDTVMPHASNIDISNNSLAKLPLIFLNPLLGPNIQLRCISGQKDYAPPWLKRLYSQSIVHIR